MNSLILAVLLLTTPAESEELSAQPLKCMLLHTQDHFWFYREQMIFQSDQFLVFQNLKGRVVTQVDLKSGEWIRTTYIGEPYDPRYQILLGYCSNVQDTLKKWQKADVIYDQ